jgi:hypothetical protein
LDTETYRVVAWLLARASEELKAKGEPDSEQTARPSPKPLGADDIVAFALTSALDLPLDRRKIYKLRDLSEEDEGKKFEERLNRELAGMTLVIDARLGGLKSGLLENTVSDLHSAEYNTFGRHIKKLSRILHSETLEPISSSLIEGVDLDAWIKADKETQGVIRSRRPSTRPTNARGLAISVTLAVVDWRHRARHLPVVKTRFAQMRWSFVTSVLKRDIGVPLRTA